MSTGDLLLRVECYVAVRKALGYACRSEEKLLNNFVRFLELNGASGPIRAQTAIEWVCAPAHGPAPSGQTNRLRVVRGFLSHLQAFEFETEVPGPGVLPPILRPLPYLYSPDEIAALMKEASRLGPNDSLRPHTYVALIGLLASSGLRVPLLPRPHLLKGKRLTNTRANNINRKPPLRHSGAITKAL